MRSGLSFTPSTIVVTDRVSANQSALNDVIQSLATKIPEHLFYTALPQLISRVVHQNRETSSNVALIIRNVLVKYPRQSMWSCGWLRFSKTKEKKKAGDVSLLSSIEIVGIIVILGF